MCYEIIHTQPQRSKSLSEVRITSYFIREIQFIEQEGQVGFVYPDLEYSGQI